MKNIIFKKLCLSGKETITAKKTSPRPFYQKSKLDIYLDQQSEMLCSLFLLYVQVEVHKK